MAESSTEQREQRLTARRWRARPLVAIAAIALAGAATPVTPAPPPVAVAPERARIARTRELASDVLSIPARMLERWNRLLLALPGIGETPTSRSDTPVLPTVGRPRDVPVSAAA